MLLVYYNRSAWRARFGKQRRCNIDIDLSWRNIGNTFVIFIWNFIVDLRKNISSIKEKMSTPIYQAKFILIY